MIINGKVYCFFEQSGTFKNEFIKLGIPAEDYDIQNNFGETDHVEDLFKAIEVIDHNRQLRGDFFKKPTQYWFVNCSPTYGCTEQKTDKKKTIMGSRGASKAGLCSEERSMISPDYARNFICDFIIGREQTGTQLNLF